MNNITLALDSLLTRHANLYKDSNKYHLPTFIVDEPWPSPCVRYTDEDTYFWQATRKESDDLFNDLEAALEIKFHPDATSFYTSFWANGLRVEHPDVDLSLIQTWNEEDEARLKENILGHCFAKMKARLPLTIFIGATDSNEVVSIDNESGQIVLERPGRKAHKILAENLESFLLALSPTKELY
jgi:SecY interacting protein Syd